MNGWSNEQVTLFAKRFANSAEGFAWWAFVEEIREALIDTFVLGLVFSQKGEIRIEDIKSLRKRLVDELANKHRLQISRPEW